MYIYKIIPRATIKNYTNTVKRNSILKWNTKTCSNSLTEENKDQNNKKDKRH